MNTMEETISVASDTFSLCKEPLSNKDTAENNRISKAEEIAKNQETSSEAEIPCSHYVLLKEYHVRTIIKMFIYSILKRMFDIICSLFGLIVLIPILLLVKISYLISGDTKTIFFTQTRIGRFGKKFQLYKIRSMVYNADEVLAEMLKDKKYQKEWKENQKIHDDPRITKIGKFLRKTSLDELPQIINVLKGDMSIIGPRPLVEGELDEHGGRHEIYESVKPGLTGWWGCNGRSATSYEERLNLENYYVLNASLGLDIKTVFKTIKVILKAEGAK